MKRRNLFGHGKLAAIISICLFLIALLPSKNFAQSGGKWATGGNSISSTEFFGTLNNAPIVFKTLNTEKMRLLSNGYLGIGVTDPEAMLHVDGTIRFNSLNGTANGLVVANKFGTLQRISFTGNNRHVLLGDGTFAPYSDDDWLVSGNNMTTIPTGNVGIGVNTFSGNYKLEVGGDVKINGGLTVREITAENGKLVFNNTDLYTDGFLLVDNITSSAGTINFNNSNITTTGSISANNLIFTGIPTFENLTINGLTTTNALNVNENINVSNMLNFTGPTPSIYAQGDLNIGSGQDIILSTSSKVSMPEAKLGIGVFNPTETLDVGGNANIRGTLYVQNGVIIGQRMESDVIDVVEIIRAPILELSESLFIEHELTVPTAHMQNLSIDGQNSKITSTSGSINFDNENLNTTGAINAGSLQANALTVIGNSTLEGSLTTGIVDALEVNVANIRSSMGIQTDGNILSQSIETNDLTINGTTTINGEINIDELKVGTQIQVGSNSLFLSSGLNQDNSVENSIYTDNGDLKIQSNGGTNNTIINAGNNGKVGIGTTNLLGKLNVGGKIVIEGPDLILGTNDTREQGTKLMNRALVHDGWQANSDNLVINYDGDFEDGVFVMGPKTIFTGNVGIGTQNNPLERFEVNGAIKVGSGSNNSEGAIKYENGTFSGHDANGWRTFGSPWSMNGANDITYNTGDVTIGKLAGTGMRMVTADAFGKLGTADMPDISSLCSSLSCGSDGHIGISTGTASPLGYLQLGNTNKKIVLGDGFAIYTSAYDYWNATYMGFNAGRQDDGSWLLNSDGASNGGSIILSDAGGSIRFVTIPNCGNTPPNSGANNQTFTDAEIISKTKMIINSEGKVGIGLMPNQSTQANLHIYKQITSATESVSIRLQRKNLTVGGQINDAIWDIQNIGEKLNFNFNNESYLSLKNKGLSSDPDAVIVGTSSHVVDFKVNGTIYSNEVKIRTDHWSDFVFKPNYDLLPLNELESFIAKNKHLPDVPSEKEMLENGNDLGKTDALLLQKIEELTLYLLQLKNENQDLKARLDNIEKNHK